MGRLLILLAFLMVSTSVRAQVRPEFSLFNESFISPDFEGSPSNNYQFAALSLHSDADSKDPLIVQAEGGVAFGAPLLNYLNVSELYYQNQSLVEDQSFFIGRKSMNWNELDSRWQLGLWQPIFQWNPLNPQEQGMTGFFWETKKQNYNVTIFVSPVFIPNQGPSYDIENGQFVQGNPWFQRPPESVQIFSESTQVDYTMDKPGTSQVLFHASYGAKVSYGSPDDLFIQASYMYKPSNQLALTYSGVLDTSKLVGEVDIQPLVFEESLIGMDLTKRYGQWLFGISGLVDHPQNDLDVTPGYTYPVFSNAVLISPFIEWHHPWFTLSLQSLNVQGGQVQEVGDLASPDRAPLTLLYPYQQAIRVSMANDFSLGGPRQLTSKISYTFSQENDFELIQWSLRYRWSWVWSVFGGLELIRAGDLSVVNQNEISQYRTDDQVMTGVAYAF